MTTDRTPVLTGGCQCGAVRYAMYAEPYNPHICHCRMCQKAFGSYFAPFANVKLQDFAWTSGMPRFFRSSSVVERGFCADCGTPLSFRFDDTDRIGISLGSLDEPAKVPPARQFGMESRLVWFATLHALPGQTTDEILPAELRQKLTSRQHPDRDMAG